MNVLLVDDQVRILEATYRLVDWKSLGVEQVFKATSAKTAREILQTYPVDIMLADIEMPEENGILLRKWQRKEYPSTACIFLTSHADFSYAKDAIRDGVFDYILQPAGIPEIENALKRCIQDLKEKEALEKKVRQYDSKIGDTLKNHVFTLFFRKGKLFSMEDWRRDSGTQEEEWCYLPCLVECWRTDKEDMEKILEEELVIQFGEKYRFVIASLNEGENAFLMYTREKKLSYLEVSGGMQLVLERINKRTGGELNIYVGQYVKNELQYEAVKLIGFVERRVLRRNQVYLVDTVKTPEIKRPDSTVWARWLIRRDGMLIRNQITNLIHFTEQEQTLSVDYIQQLFQTLLEACSIACYDQDRNISELFSDEEFARMMKPYKAVAEMLDGVDFCLQQYDRVICGKEDTDDLYSAQERIREIPRYINENMDRMISRKEAAKYVFLSEDYFSRTFRKEYGMGYKEYVLKEKMEYAKRILRDTDMPVTLVASRVGYENYTNFTQMFRKLEDTTPKDYRKQYRKEEQWRDAGKKQF